MTDVNVSLPEPMKQYIEERLREGDYNNVGEFFRDLIREDQKRRAAQREEALLLRGLASQASEWTPDDVEALKQAVRERHAEKKEQA